jgi:hypothetical protein
MCLYVYPTIIARQRLGKKITAATNTQTILEELFSAGLYSEVEGCLLLTAVREVPLPATAR